MTLFYRQFPSTKVSGTDLDILGDLYPLHLDRCEPSLGFVEAVCMNLLRREQ